MYCILVTGIPASGKSTTAIWLSERLGIPVISKDKIKELMYDDIGFRSRQEKVSLGVASMSVMYYMASQLMKCHLPFILENNFENTSKEPLMRIIEKYSYKAITITLTGDYQKIYERFVERNRSSNRHRGHVVNDCYPETGLDRAIQPVSYETYMNGIISRGMDCFVANGPHIIVDTTEFDKEKMSDLLKKLILYREEVLHD